MQPNKLGIVPLGGLIPDTTHDYSTYAKENKFDFNKKPPLESPILTLNGNLIGSRGNILVITGKSKSRKSVVASGIATSMFTTSGFLGFESHLNERDQVLHLDTEQGYYHYFNWVSKTFSNAGFSDVPKNFHSYRSRSAKHKFRIGLLEYLCDLHKPRVVIIDGITDLMSNINDHDEATEIGELLQGMSEQYDSLFIPVIHTTKSTGSMTGVIGTTLEKKCQTSIETELTEGDEKFASNVICKYSRDRAFDTFTIRYNEELHNYEVTPESKVITKGKGGNKAPEAYGLEVHRSVCNMVFGYSGQVPMKDLNKVIKAKVKVITNDDISLLLAGQWQTYWRMNNYLLDGPDGYFLKAAQFNSGEKKPEVDQMQPVIDFNNPADNMDDLPF